MIDSILDELKSRPTIGCYNFPVIKKCNETPQSLLPFNCALTQREYKRWLHFFIDDIQFERIWNNPKRYLSTIRKFEGVIAPNFSMFTNMPQAQQIYNCWRSGIIAAWLQNCGIKVIPVIEWSDKKSLEWCLDGLPMDSTLAVQTNGSFKNCRSKIDFIKGMEYAINELNPTSILIYGKGEEYKNYFPNAYFVNSYCQEMKKRL